MTNYHQLNKQIHPLSSKKIPEYIQRELSYQHLTDKNGYIFIPTLKQYKRDIFPLTYPGSKRRFKKLILTFFPDLFT